MNKNKDTEEKNKDKAAEEESSSKAAVQRGEEAIKADEKINKKELDASQVKAEREKDAEQWRNEG
jgi:hypothetical protein